MIRMNFRKGQKECAELLRFLKDDKIHCYSKWGAGGAIPGERSTEQRSEIKVHIDK